MKFICFVTLITLISNFISSTNGCFSKPEGPKPGKVFDIYKYVQLWLYYKLTRNGVQLFMHLPTNPNHYEPGKNWEHENYNQQKSDLCNQKTTLTKRIRQTFAFEKWPWK